MTEGGVAVVFPGQGSQVPGMAVPWRDHPAYARWHDASDVLGRDVTRLGTDAGADELRDPATCQIALFVHHAVLAEAWAAAGGGRPAATAGHSLGEYDALLVAGALDFADALRLVEARAAATGAAAVQNPGTMVACLGFDDGVVADTCTRVGAHVANDNAPGQVVVSGAPDALDALRGELAALRGKVVQLEVGAAYHSPHMAPAVEPLGAALDRAAWRDTAVPVVANVDARPHTDASGWPQRLREQVVAPVRWRETVTTLAEMGVTQLVELAATPVLTGMAKRTMPSLARRGVTTPADLA